MKELIIEYIYREYNIDPDDIVIKAIIHKYLGWVGTPYTSRYVSKFMIISACAASYLAGWYSLIYYTILICKFPIISPLLMNLQIDWKGKICIQNLRLFLCFGKIFNRQGCSSRHNERPGR